MKKKIGPISKVLKTTSELWKSEATMRSSEVQLPSQSQSLLQTKAPESSPDKNVAWKVVYILCQMVRCSVFTLALFS